jgi:hypothetical protein
MDSMANIARVSIVGNPSLTSIAVFDGLAELTCDEWPARLVIFDNDALTRIDGFSDLVYLDGDLYIEGNGSLCQSDMEDFAASIEVTGTVAVAENDGECL